MLYEDIKCYISQETFMAFLIPLKTLFLFTVFITMIINAFGEMS